MGKAKAKKVIPIKPRAKVLAASSWSFSRYQDYQRCPAYFKYRHLLRMKSDAGPAAARGTDIHNKAEQYLNGTIKVMPVELAKLRTHYLALRKLGAKGELVQEQMWGHDREWRVCDPRAWDVCWLRVKTDVAYLSDKGRVLNIDDHKSGRIKEDAHQEQLSLYGVSALHRYPTVQEVHGRMLYVDKKAVRERIVKRSELTAVTTQWEHRVAFMFADRRFAPRPNNSCTYCDYSKAKGGPCQY